jgi:hypothetical protein
MLSYLSFGGALLDGDSPSPCTRSFLDNLDLDVKKQSHDTDEYKEQKVRDHNEHRRDRFVNSFPEGTMEGRRPRRLVVSLFFPERRRPKDWVWTLWHRRWEQRPPRFGTIRTRWRSNRESQVVVSRKVYKEGYFEILNKVVVIIVVDPVAEKVPGIVRLAGIMLQMNGRRSNVYRSMLPPILHLVVYRISHGDVCFQREPTTSMYVRNVRVITVRS